MKVFFVVEKENRSKQVKTASLTSGPDPATATDMARHATS